MNYPLLDTFLTICFVFVGILWIFLVILITVRIFRSHDLGGWGKAGWLALVILLPFIGAIAYVVARGDQLADDHAASGGALEEQKFQTYERYIQRR